MITILLLLVSLSPLTHGGHTVHVLEVSASADASLIEDPTGSVADGKGAFLRAGRTAQVMNGTRRAILRFDVAQALPEHAIVLNAELTLHVTQTNAGPTPVSLQRVRTEWFEGPSSSSGGQGAAARPGDVTWLHNSYDQELWSHAGGDVKRRASAVAEVDAPGAYSWENSRGLVNDVRLWAHASHRNFGWMLVGDESVVSTVKAFASREHAVPQMRPVLRIAYRLPGH